MYPRDGVTGLSRGHHLCACMCITTRTRCEHAGREGDPDRQAGQPVGRSAGRARTSQAARVTDGHIAFRGSISPRFRGCNSRKVVSGPCSAGAARRMCASVYTASLHRPPSGFPSPQRPHQRSHPRAAASSHPSIFFSLDFCPLFQAFLLPACIPLAAER